jgi:hypothetical protein
VRNEGAGAGQIGFDGTNVTFGMTTIGTVDATENGADGANLRIILTAGATAEAIERLIENFTLRAVRGDDRPQPRSEDLGRQHGGRGQRRAATPPRHHARRADRDAGERRGRAGQQLQRISSRPRRGSRRWTMAAT